MTTDTVPAPSVIDARSGPQKLLSAQEMASHSIDTHLKATRGGTVGRLLNNTTQMAQRKSWMEQIIGHRTAASEVFMQSDMDAAAKHLGGLDKDTLKKMAADATHKGHADIASILKPTQASRLSYIQQQIGQAGASHSVVETARRRAAITQLMEPMAKYHDLGGGQVITQDVLSKTVHSLGALPSNELEALIEDGKQHTHGHPNAVLEHMRAPLDLNAPTHVPGVAPTLTPERTLLNNELQQRVAAAKGDPAKLKQLAHIERIVGGHIDAPHASANPTLSAERMTDVVKQLEAHPQAHLETLEHTHADFTRLTHPTPMERIGAHTPGHRTALQGLKPNATMIPHAAQFEVSRTHIAHELSEMTKSASVRDRVALAHLKPEHLDQVAHEYTAHQVSGNAGPFDLKTKLGAHVHDPSWQHTHTLTTERENLFKHAATDQTLPVGDPKAFDKAKYDRLVAHDAEMVHTHKFTDQAHYDRVIAAENKALALSHRNITDLHGQDRLDRLAYHKEMEALQKVAPSPIHEHVMAANMSRAQHGVGGHTPSEIRNGEHSTDIGKFRTGKCGTVVHLPYDGSPAQIVQHGKDSKQFLKTVEAEVAQAARGGNLVQRTAGKVPGVLATGVGHAANATGYVAKKSVGALKGAGKAVLVTGAVAGGLFALHELLKAPRVPRAERMDDDLLGGEPPLQFAGGSNVSMGAMAVPQVGQGMQMGSWAGQSQGAGQGMVRG